MKLTESTASIVEDFKRLGLLYTLEMDSVDKTLWKKNFQMLSLNSHTDNQLLFLSSNRITIRGIVKPRHAQLDQVFIQQDVTGNAFDNKKGRSLLSSVSGLLFSLSTRAGLFPRSILWSCKCSFVDDTSYQVIAALSDGTRHQIGRIRLVPKYVEDNNDLPRRLTKKIKAIESSRSIMQKNIADNRNYLFVTGNPRSGTTALLNLVNTSSEVCLGNERYKKINITANGFERASFFNSSSPRFKKREELYRKLDSKFDNARYVGDKRPGLTLDWRNTLLNIPAATILYIFRDIYGVAASYNERAVNAASGTDQTWSRDRNFSAAIEDWNFEIQQALLIAEHSDLTFVKYEDIFISESDIHKMFKSINIDSSEPDIAQAIGNTIGRGKALKIKDRTLDTKALAYIEAHADHVSYNRMVKLYEQQ